MSKFFINQSQEDAIVKWIESVLPILVIDNTDPNAVQSKILWAEQDANIGIDRIERPSRPYVSLEFISGPNQIGTSWKKYDSSQPTESIYNYTAIFQVTLSISIFAKKNHLFLAQQLRSSLDLPSKYTILSNGGWGIYPSTPIIDISRLQNANHELRASFDLPLSYSYTSIDDSGLIETTNFDGTITTPNDTININTTTP